MSDQINELDMVEVISPYEGLVVGEQVVALSVFGDEALDVERVHEAGSGDLIYSVPMYRVKKAV